MKRPDANNPSSTWYWKDYENDEGLRVSSLAAQGLWMRLMCIAAKAEPYGYIVINGSDLGVTGVARLGSISEAEAADLLAELERNGVFSRDRKGRMFSRRLVRDAATRKKARENGAKGGNPALTASDGKEKKKRQSVNPPVKRQGNPDTSPPFPSSLTLSPLHPSDASGVVEEAVAAPASEPLWSPDRLLSEILSIVGLKEGRTTEYWMPPGASIHVWRWHTDQNLTCPEILQVITSSHDRHERTPPKGPKAFDRAIALFASIKFAPPPDIIPPPNGAIHVRAAQNRPDRRADESERLSRILDAAARGTT